MSNMRNGTLGRIHLANQQAEADRAKAAQDPFLSAIGKFNQLVAQLTELGLDHFNVTPDDVNFAHVATVKAANAQLAAIVAFLRSEER